jgi:hypothetical protein
MAIFLAGVALPELTRAAHWRAFALAQTAANLQADLLPDGVHCELSTDYHHLALRNWLQVRTWPCATAWPLPPGMDEALERGFEFSLHVHQPQGLVPSLSDGDVRSYLPLLAQGAELFGRDDMRFVATRGAARLGAGAAPGALCPRAATTCCAALGPWTAALRRPSTWCWTAARWAKATTATSTR